ncbi:MAG: hypothetical protein KVP17_002851 [Porospora cf. gigantea B]|uniref:uncharacterized protein n=1 Tax=Porospora cf. gigantea B TaxID=2853592 RepID=UPI003571950A|nr:MAG: hypothetical protein KVP17_002851 [Porospora cf. gigantea B]
MIIGVDVVQCVVVDRQGFRFRRTDLRHAKPMRFRCLTPTHLSEADPEESSGETLQWRELNSLRETRLTAESSGDPKRQYRFYWPLPDEVASLETEESLEWVEPKGMGEYDGCVLDFGDRGSLPKLQKQGRKVSSQKRGSGNPQSRSHERGSGDPQSRSHERGSGYPQSSEATHYQL